MEIQVINSLMILPFTAAHVILYSTLTRQESLCQLGIKIQYMKVQMSLESYGREEDLSVNPNELFKTKVILITSFSNDSPG